MTKYKPAGYPKYKYYFYLLRDDNIELIGASNTLQHLKKVIENSELAVEPSDQYLLTTINRAKDYTPEERTFKFIEGPFKVTFKLYMVNKKGSIVPYYTLVKKYDIDKNKYINTRETHGINIQYVYITDEWIKRHGFNLKYIEKLSYLAFHYDLKRKLLESKTIDKFLK